MTKTRTFNDNSHSLKRRKRKLMGLYGAPRDVDSTPAKLPDLSTV